MKVRRLRSVQLKLKIRKCQICESLIFHKHRRQATITAFINVKLRKYENSPLAITFPQSNDYIKINCHFASFRCLFLLFLCAIYILNSSFQSIKSNLSRCSRTIGISKHLDVNKLNLLIERRMITK